jgi:hypothetical protein
MLRPGNKMGPVYLINNKEQQQVKDCNNTDDLTEVSEIFATMFFAEEKPLKQILLIVDVFSGVIYIRFHESEHNFSVFVF